MTYREALAFMGFEVGRPIVGTKIDVAFIGSCTNSRLSDLRVAADVARRGKVAKGVRALVVPGSQAVAELRSAKGATRSSGPRLRMAARRAARCCSA